MSLLSIDDGVFEVLATAGDTNLGGEDLDNRVMEYFIKLYKKKTGIDVSKNRSALGKLKREVEKPSVRSLASSPPASRSSRSRTATSSRKLSLAPSPRRGT